MGSCRGADVTMPENNAENAEAIKQWKQRNAKAEFVLKRFISLALFDHIIHSAHNSGVKTIIHPIYHFYSRVDSQPSTGEFESLLSFKESLAKQMARVSIKSKEGSAPLAKRKNFVKRSERRKDLDKNKGDVTSSKKSIKCFVMDWIVDLVCGHHLTDDESKFSKLQDYEGNQGPIDDEEPSCFDEDPSLFVKKNQDARVIVLLHVDDMIVTANDENEVAKLKEELSIRFEMKILGKLSHFLSLEVEHLKNEIFISQKGKKQDLVSLSAAEAEYKAAALTAQECIWLRRPVKNVYLSINKLTQLFRDNQTA
ncbi:hypothetical protein GH714_014109 [Hevea brasiliensis]|uniref:Reverse transcriptase Ty1/copia-type domain-containing protein n=1 Tax=Hevea brasiliensis TaxID=3981 RepID=A0A6A6KND9_HEVBR|nr:hypothetical protein GH714_014109 [Hevea brasiliensis]